MRLGRRFPLSRTLFIILLLATAQHAGDEPVHDDLPIFHEVNGTIYRGARPKEGGIVNQFASIGWKYYGQYGRWVESWIIRGEFSSSLFS